MVQHFGFGGGGKAGVDLAQELIKLGFGFEPRGRLGLEILGIVRWQRLVIAGILVAEAQEQV
jgi:hypothetical protein